MDIEVVKDPNLLNNILRHVSLGGTVLEYCQENQLDYYEVRSWINREENRVALVDEAETFRKQVISEALLIEVRDLAMLDISKMYDANGEILPIEKMPASLKKSIKSIERDGMKVKIQFIDKLKAIELLAKTTDVFKQRIEVSASESLESLINASFKGE